MKSGSAPGGKHSFTVCVETRLDCSSWIYMTVEGGMKEGSQTCRKSGFQQDKASCLHEVTLACLGRGTYATFLPPAKA